MKITTLGQGVSLTAAAAQTAVQMNTTPFLNGRELGLMTSAAGATGTPTVKVQGSEDNSTWTDIATFALADITAARMQTITASRYMRLNVTAVGTAGTVNAYLFSEV